MEQQTEAQFAADVAKMATDPEVILQVRLIDEEFRACEEDGLTAV